MDSDSYPSLLTIWLWGAVCSLSMWIVFIWLLELVL